MIPTDLSPLWNHLWQSTLCAAVVWLLTLAVRKNRAAVRYWLWFAASLKFLVPFPLLVSAASQLEWRTTPVNTPPAIAFAVEQVSQPFAVPASARTPVRSSPIPAILLVLWFTGAVIGIGFWLRWWRSIQTVRRAARPLPMNLPIPVMSVPGRLEPGVFGILKPVLLLPDGIAGRLNPEQLEAVIAHEVCHIRRRDNLTAAIHMVVETVFWFHPLVWWIRTRLVEERERACDEDVLRQADPHVYAEGILNVCKFYLESPLVCASGVTGADLKKRIEKIIASHFACNLDWRRKVLLAVAGTAVVAVPLAAGILNAPARAQSENTATLKFEVASVKPSNEPCCSSTWDSSPAGSLRMKNQTLRSLIRIAYRVKDEQIAGGPKWLDSDRYSVDAKAPLPASDSNILLMLQALLAERFQLSLHKETRRVSGYSLVVAKNGLKIRPVPPSTNNQLNVKGGHMTAQAASLDRLTLMLENILHAPVSNDTHLTDIFDFQLDWTPDSTNIENAGNDPAGGGSIFTAIQETLGLKLEAHKVPEELLVVDRAEKPSEN